MNKILLNLIQSIRILTLDSVENSYPLLKHLSKSESTVHSMI